MRNVLAALIVVSATFFTPEGINSAGFSAGKGDRNAPAGKELLSLACSSPGKMTLAGNLDDEAGIMVLTDPAGSLGLERLAQSPAEFSFERRISVNEPQYPFAKFVRAAAENDSFEFSLPKKVLSGEETGEFSAYFSVYENNGGNMAPGEPVKMSCGIKGGRYKLFTDCFFQTDCPPNEGCNKWGKCEYNSFIPPGEGNKCFSEKQCHKGNVCVNEHCVGLWK
jgi:hypothetical protein